MNILPVNNIIVSNINCQQKQTDNRVSRFGLYLSKPLNCDTISFKESPKALLNRTNGISRAVAKDINKIGAERQWKVVEFLYRTFGHLIVTEEKPDNIITKLAFRVKSDLSIEEKAATNEWTTKDKVLQEMTDINGGKAVLRDGSRKGVNVILDCLMTAINKNEIEIFEIENKRPMVTQDKEGFEASKYDYADPERIMDLFQRANKLQKHKIKEKHFKPADYTKSNYPALHFLLKFPGENWAFEFQVMGYDVDLYKGLDDILFKIINNKNVDKKFKKIKEIIDPLNKPENTELLEQFNKYRSNVFLFQRAKAPHIRKNDKYVERFLPVSDEIEDYDMREILDMNNLYSIYLDCINKSEKKKTR